MNNPSEEDTASERGRMEDASSAEEEEELPTEQEEEVELEIEDEDDQSQTQDAGQSTGESADEFADLPELDYVDDWMWIIMFPEYEELLSTEERDDFRQERYESFRNAAMSPPSTLTAEKDYGEADKEGEK